MKRHLGKIAAPLLVLVMTAGAATRTQAQSFTVLYNFKGSGDGANPFAGLVMDAAGNLYGTTNNTYGDSTLCNPSPVYGCGIVFKVDPSGRETVLHSFTKRRW